MKKQIIFISVFLLFVPLIGIAQKMGDTEIKQLINQYKKDPRGLYKDIRWFCPDGSVNLPREYCEEEGGIQHARHKDEVKLLGLNNHEFTISISKSQNNVTNSIWSVLIMTKNTY